MEINQFISFRKNVPTIMSGTLHLPTAFSHEILSNPATQTIVTSYTIMMHVVSARLQQLVNTTQHSQYQAKYANLLLLKMISTML